MKEEPKVIKLNDVETKQPYQNSKNRIKRIITKKNEGATKFGAGLCFMDPDDSNWWIFEEGEEEMYYMLKGTLTINYGEKEFDEHRVELKESDSFWFAPGYKYKISNKTLKPIEFLWVISPSRE